METKHKNSPGNVFSRVRIMHTIHSLYSARSKYRLTIKKTRMYVRIFTVALILEDWLPTTWNGRVFLSMFEDGSF